MKSIDQAILLINEEWANVLKVKSQLDKSEQEMCGIEEISKEFYSLTTKLEHLNSDVDWLYKTLKKDK